MTARLDDSALPAADALHAREFPRPRALYLLGTGLGVLPGELEDRRTLALDELEGTPEPWRAAELVAGTLGGTPVWLLEDAPSLPALSGGEAGSPAWERAWPVWLAAAAGARTAALTAAGVALGEGLAPGRLAVLEDHLNLSGRSPLEGLGESRLGPLFPDQTQVHDPRLRERARDLARARGLDVPSAVGACTLGPALWTPAELRWLASTGAGVVVQGLADPLIAAAHAGLAVVALVPLVDDGREARRMAELVDASEGLAPALEDLLVALAPELGELAEALEREIG